MKEEYVKITPNEYPLGYFFHLANSRSGHNFIKKNIQSWMGDKDQKNRKFTNLENRTISDVNQHLLNDKYLHKHPNSIYVMSIRDILNWYTSLSYFHLNNINEVDTRRVEYFKSKTIIYKSDLLKNPELEFDENIVILEDGRSKTEYLKKKTNQKYSISLNLSKGLDRWLEYAKEFTGETNHLPQFVKIYYNDFFKSNEYRKSICENLGGVYNESELNYVTKGGGYSTFDKDKFQGSGQQMNVLERYKEWKPEHHEYLKLLKEHTAFEFYLNNFDILPDEMDFINSI